MFGKDYWNRIKLKQICSFTLTGAERIAVDSGTYEELYQQYSRDLENGMLLFRDRAVADCKRIEKLNDVQVENMWKEVLEAIGNLNDLAYEIGFVSGARIESELLGGERLM